jgi:membrane associated rhomboid family serine protease
MTVQKRPRPGENMTGGQPRAFNVPAVVVWLLAAMIAIHVVRAVLPPELGVRMLVTFAFIPARAAGMVPGWSMGEDAWSWLTYALLHADITHLFVNSIWLLAFASPVARRFGTVRFLLLGAVSAVAGALVHLLTHWGEMVFLVGASAAVSAYMGAAIRFVFDGPQPLAGLGAGRGQGMHGPAKPILAALQNRTTMTFLLVWIAINFLFGVGALAVPGATGGIAWEAHIGGFAVGFLGFSLFDPPPPAGSRPPSSRFRVIDGGGGNGHLNGRGED